LGVAIISTGKALPELKVENQKLTELVETDHQWIIERTGIESRRIATWETGVDLAAAAAREAMGDMDKASIGLVLVATVSPDMLVPSMGALVKRALGLENAVAYDINAACSGFIYGLWNAEALRRPTGFSALWSSALSVFPGSPTGKTEEPAFCLETGQAALSWNYPKTKPES
jgi:3-oxoacyl-[acyl-carrier-protein] synthase-3